jgi:hypothetical protein
MTDIDVGPAVFRSVATTARLAVEYDRDPSRGL